MAVVKRSRQREAIKDFLMSRKDHPTAACCGAGGDRGIFARRRDFLAGGCHKQRQYLHEKSSSHGSAAGSDEAERTGGGTSV